VTLPRPEYVVVVVLLRASVTVVRRPSASYPKLVACRRRW